MSGAGGLTRLVRLVSAAVSCSGRPRNTTNSATGARRIPDRWKHAASFPMGLKRQARQALSTRPAAKLGGGGGWNLTDRDPNDVFPAPEYRVSAGRLDLVPKHTPSLLSSPRSRHGSATRATVDGDPGVSNPGDDSQHLLVRGEGIQGEDVHTTFANAGLTPEQIKFVLSEHPLIETAYSLRNEIQPRLNYMRFLVDNDRLGGETVVECVLRQPQSLERNFSLVHECEQYSAVNKPWCVRLDTPRGWPGKTRFTEKYPGDLSVEDWLERKYVGNNKWDQVRFCHQLDNATSGVLLAAASKKAAAAAAKLFRERSAKKQYLALVFGHPEHDEWSCTAVLGRDPHDPKGFKERVVTSVEEGLVASEMLEGKASNKAKGKACETKFSVVARGMLTLKGKFFGTKVAKILVTPVTGRRHQIRVHLAHCGHPIVGDNAYSEDTDSFRTFLHALSLEMPFPEPTGTLTFHAPEPGSFAAAMTTEFIKE